MERRRSFLEMWDLEEDADGRIMEEIFAGKVGREVDGTVVVVVAELEDGGGEVYKGKKLWWSGAGGVSEEKGYLGCGCGGGCGCGDWEGEGDGGWVVKGGGRGGSGGGGGGESVTGKKG